MMDMMCVIDVMWGRVKSKNLYYQQPNRLNKSGIEETSVLWRKAFPEITDNLLPGLTLKGTRQLAGLTQQQLADQTGMSRTQISALENGKQSIRRETAKKLAKVFKVSDRLFLKTMPD